MLGRTLPTVAAVLYAVLYAAPYAATAQAEPTCPLRMVEPRLEDIERGARLIASSELASLLAAEDAAARQLAVVAEWYSARGDADEERRTRATAALFESWDRYRPAGRLMRIVGRGLSEEGWPTPEPEDILRRLSQMGDRDAVLERVRAVADAEDVSREVIQEALTGATAMSVLYDAEALALAGRLLMRLDAPLPAAQTTLYRAEDGDAEALVMLGAAYRSADPEACVARIRISEGLFPPSTP